MPYRKKNKCEERGTEVPPPSVRLRLEGQVEQGIADAKAHGQDYAGADQTADDQTSSTRPLETLEAVVLHAVHEAVFVVVVVFVFVGHDVFPFWLGLNARNASYSTHPYPHC